MSTPTETLVLLGAEGFVEVKGEPWLREDITPADRERFRSENGLTIADFKACSMDKIGRPYYLVAVGEGAPQGVLDHVAKFKRMVRLGEEA